MVFARVPLADGGVPRRLALVHSQWAHVVRSDDRLWRTWFAERFTAAFHGWVDRIMSGHRAPQWTWRSLFRAYDAAERRWTSSTDAPDGELVSDEIAWHQNVVCAPFAICDDADPLRVPVMFVTFTVDNDIAVWHADTLRRLLYMQQLSTRIVRSFVRHFRVGSDAFYVLFVVTHDELHAVRIGDDVAAAACVSVAIDAQFDSNAVISHDGRWMLFCALYEPMAFEFDPAAFELRPLPVAVAPSMRAVIADAHFGARAWLSRRLLPSLTSDPRMLAVFGAAGWTTSCAITARALGTDGACLQLESLYQQDVQTLELLESARPAAPRLLACVDALAAVQETPSMIYRSRYAVVTRDAVTLERVGVDLELDLDVEPVSVCVATGAVDAWAPDMGYVSGAPSVVDHTVSTTMRALVITSRRTSLGLEWSAASQWAARLAWTHFTLPPRGIILARSLEARRDSLLIMNVPPALQGQRCGRDASSDNYGEFSSHLNRITGLCATPDYVVSGATSWTVSVTRSRATFDRLVDQLRAEFPSETPVDKVVTPPTPDAWSVVLVVSGAFSPPHVGHIELLERARAALEADGLHVAAGYLVPASDRYNKSGLYPARERLRMCEAAVAESDWIMVSKQSVFRHGQASTEELLVSAAQAVSRRSGRRVLGIVVCGHDNVLVQPVRSLFDNPPVALPAGAAPSPPPCTTRVVCVERAPSDAVEPLEYANLHIGGRDLDGAVQLVRCADERSRAAHVSSSMIKAGSRFDLLAPRVAALMQLRLDRERELAAKSRT